MIKEIVEKDGSKSFELTVINPPLADVLNEDGLIIRRFRQLKMSFF
jgi:hypothetical protein